MNTRNFKTHIPMCTQHVNSAHHFPEARLRCKVKNGDFTSFGCAQTTLVNYYYTFLFCCSFTW